MKFKLLTQDEFLKRYFISEFALNQEIKIGELYVVKIQGKILIPEDAAKFCYATVEEIGHFECGDRIYTQNIKLSDVRGVS